MMFGVYSLGLSLGQMSLFFWLERRLVSLSAVLYPLGRMHTYTLTWTYAELDMQNCCVHICTLLQYIWVGLFLLQRAGKSILQNWEADLCANAARLLFSHPATRDAFLVSFLVSCLAPRVGAEVGRTSPSTLNVKKCGVPLFNLDPVRSPDQLLAVP